MQHYNHEMRSYSPAVSLQAFQILDKLYIIDSAKLGIQIETLNDCDVIKITSKATASAMQATKVIETGTVVLAENIATGVDFRLRPIPAEYISMIQKDFVNLKDSFDRLASACPWQSVIKDRPVQVQGNSVTTLGKLLTLRDELAKKHDEGP